MTQKMIRCTLTKEEVEALQEKIVREHWMPNTEQFGHLGYMASYTVEGVKYLFHNKGLMGLSVYKLEDVK